MNRIVMSMRTIARIAACLALPLAVACQEAPAVPPPLEGAAIGGPFELVNSAGETVRWSDFDGSYRMVYFGYTWCPDVCPFDLNRMMSGYRQWAEGNPDLAAQVQPIFITIDPERDTPEKMAEYTANFGDNLMGLTGSPEAIAEAAQNFSVFYERGPDDANVGYLMQHSNAGYLMGRNGEPIALLSVDESPDMVAAELGQWVR
ncbi:SCO family protein [Alteraurantiacibacter aquimixticola]|uniref:SCO family protein n=1 Tax=Alteraurantiacibacter aquimixticola TaxID=2489173 RepID=A0A4T3F0F4_9SPHN|nr:SCO family protein [Alteraurantiacibacter aquimixticola]TIX49652.1 SCO family protein [Alteraurantiacibacter aquimixticola]